MSGAGVSSDRRLTVRYSAVGLGLTVRYSARYSAVGLGLTVRYSVVARSSEFRLDAHDRLNIDYMSIYGNKS